MSDKKYSFFETIMYGAIFITSFFVKVIMYIDQFFRLRFRKLFNRKNDK